MTGAILAAALIAIAAPSASASVTSPVSPTPGSWVTLHGSGLYPASFAVTQGLFVRGLHGTPAPNEAKTCGTATVTVLGQQKIRLVHQVNDSGGHDSYWAVSASKPLAVTVRQGAAQVPGTLVMDFIGARGGATAAANGLVSGGEVDYGSAGCQMGFGFRHG